MKIRYRVFKDFSKQELKQLRVLAIDVKPGFDAFLVDADHAKLAEIKNIIAEEWESSISLETEFSEKDRCGSSFLHVYPAKLVGYPQPESAGYEFPYDLYPYFKDVFEIENTDPEFGILKGRQIGSYKLKKEPNWGSSSIGSAFWIQDSIFVKPQVYKAIFEPLGIKSLPVLEYKSHSVLKSVLQLVPQGIAEADLDIKAHHINKIESVAGWGINKYILNGVGFYPDFKSAPGDLDFFETKEFFGAGGFTVRATIISQKLYQLLVKNKVKGLSYEPMTC
ncbi:hypothetical protein [Pedobacter hiemivivus]|uniref:Uncharacterized protein n=1 Tax=Pedobacter hiemivivus TaxID=2530454 RepID=A0A4R0NK18_9SPHI|nr:hypothetical protein [Pedobacter hiemivivus]TCC99663.1 hypothetical protein EZ444_03050 [Pedobacter hiemivivus]